MSEREGVPASIAANRIGPASSLPLQKPDRAVPDCIRQLVRISQSNAIGLIYHSCHNHSVDFACNLISLDSTRSSYEPHTSYRLHLNQ